MCPPPPTEEWIKKKWYIYLHWNEITQFSSVCVTLKWLLWFFLKVSHFPSYFCLAMYHLTEKFVWWHAIYMSYMSCLCAHTHLHVYKNITAHRFQGHSEQNNFKLRSISGEDNAVKKCNNHEWQKSAVTGYDALQKTFFLKWKEHTIK